MWKLMIVDDQLWTRTGLEQGVDWVSLNIQVCASCSSGAQALSVMQQTPVDILLTDIRMPNMSGLQLAEIINRDYPNVAVVFMSAYQEFEYAFKAVQLGVHAYVLKPVDTGELVKTMKKVLSLFCGNKTSTSEEDPDRHDVVRRAKDYIHKNISSRQLNLKETADALHINYYYLSKCFKSNEQCTFTSYVNDRRLKIACGLLKTTKLNVSEICNQIGMEQKYFHELFNNKMGMSPLKYRAQK